MQYRIKFSPRSQNNIDTIQKSGEGKRLLRKINGFLEELKDHPRTGTGKPERLKGQDTKEIWSRRITDKHRLIYEIQEDVVIVLVLSAYGHYDDE